MQEKLRGRVAWVIVIGLAIVVLVLQKVESEGVRLAEHFTSPSVGQGPARMWTGAPEVAPGGLIHVRIAAEGGLRSRIVMARVSAGAAVVAASGADPWGDKIQTDSHDDNDDELELDVRAPDDARPGGSVRVTAAIDVEIAAEAAPANFRNETHHQDLDARVEVLTTGQVTLRRVWRCAWAVALLLLIGAVAWLIGRRVRVGLRGDVLVLGFLAAGTLAFAASFAFVEPVASATSLYGAWASALLTAIWVGLPVLAFVLARRRTAVALPTMRVR